MKKKLILPLLCCALILTAGCGKSADSHPSAPSDSGSAPVNSSAPAGQSEAPQASTAAPSEAVSSEDPSPAASSPADTSSGEYPQTPSDDYPYDISADQASFDSSNIDIVVGDKFYMTQINDWFTNFSDYEGKSVEIEGYYMVFGDYTFVGRKGPTCPYCTGGYVDFEFKSDDDLSALCSELSWVKVTGILRQGTMYPGSGQAPQPFYYIEAMSVEKMDQVGLDTITD